MLSFVLVVLVFVMFPLVTVPMTAVVLRVDQVELGLLTKRPFELTSFSAPVYVLLELKLRQSA